MKVYSEYFVFRGVFHENIHEVPAKCKIQKVYSQPKKGEHGFKEAMVSQDVNSSHSGF